MLDVLRYDTEKVTLVQDDDVVQALASKRPHHPFGNTIRLWTMERAQHRLDANRSRPCHEALAKAGIAVTQEKARLLAPWRRLDELPPYPVGCWMGGDVYVYELSSAVLFIGLGASVR